MPRPRFEKLPVERQAAILDAALEAFASQGFEAASFNQIIARAGVSKGAMYYYFDDKEDLFYTVVRRETARLMEMLEPFPEPGTAEAFWQDLQGWMTRFQRKILERPLTLGLFKQVLRMRAEGARHPVLDEVQQVNEQWTHELLHLGQRVGAVRTDLPDELLAAVVQAVDDAGDLYLVPRIESLSEAEIEHWSRVFMDLLRRILSPNVTYGENRT